MGHESIEGDQQEHTVFHESSAFKTRQLRGVALEWLGGAATAGVVAGVIASAVIDTMHTDHANMINIAVQNCYVAMERTHTPRETTTLPKECTPVKNRLLRQRDRLTTITFKNGKATPIVQHDTTTYFWNDEILGQAEVNGVEWGRQQANARAESALWGTGGFAVVSGIGSLVLYHRHRKRL